MESGLLTGLPVDVVSAVGGSMLEATPLVVVLADDDAGCVHRADIPNAASLTFDVGGNTETGTACPVTSCVTAFAEGSKGVYSYGTGCS